MARVKIVMPQLGESITAGTITKWHKKPGDKVELDETLFEISTEKVESEIPSIASGRVETILYKEGDKVDIGVLLCEIEDDPENVSFSSSSQSAISASASNSTSTSSSVSATTSEEIKSEPKMTEEKSSKNYTPLVKVMAKKAGVPLSELDALSGSGINGRVTKDDFDNYLKSRDHNVKAPSVTVLATNSISSISSISPISSISSSISSSASTLRDEVIPMDNMRKTIARNMIASKQISAHVSSASEVDMTSIVKFRESFKAEFMKQEGFNLTYTPFIMKAIISALKDFPKLNASINGDNIVFHKDIHLGFAVSVGKGEGLVVPVIKNADTLSMLGLCRKVNELALKARTKKLSMDDLQGGTYTFTNVGSFGTLFATPIILQPQVGIYAAGSIQKRPVVIETQEGDFIAVRSMMYGVSTYDHRLIDGETGGLFAESVHKHLKSMDLKSLF